MDSHYQVPTTLNPLSQINQPEVVELTVIQIQICLNLEPTIFFFFFVFLGLHPWHMEVPRLGVKSELQLSATAMPDPSPLWSTPQLMAMPDP